MWRNKMNSWLIKLFYCLIIILTTTLTGYRLKIWIKDYMSLSSKYYISSILTEMNDDKSALPSVSFCNINPARGSTLLSNRYKTGAPQDYELFVDTINGRINTEVPAQRLLRPYFQILDESSHKLISMLKHCSVGRTVCSHLNFTKSLLPTGACYTYNGKLSAKADINLVLDPEIHEYLVPNSGFAGFKVLIHSFHDPLWTAVPNSMYVGPDFHTYVRVNEMEKQFRRHCVSQEYWVLCMHQCLEKSIFQYCQCYLMGTNACTLSNLMMCGLNIDKLIDYLKPEKCSCTKRCRQVNYKLESITQSIKNNVFNAFLSPWSQKLNRPSNINNNNNVGSASVSNSAVDNGRAIQFWAYLRESNITAFEELRNLSICLHKLIYYINQLELTFQIVKTKLLTQSQYKRCLNASNNEIFKSGLEFVEYLKRKKIIKDLDKTPLKIIHIHLVNLLFNDFSTSIQLRQIENFTEMSHFISDLSMLDSTLSRRECFDKPKSSATREFMFKRRLKRLRRQIKSDSLKLKDSFLHLEKIFFKYITTFKTFKRRFLENVKYNKEIIIRLANLSKEYLEKEYYQKSVTVTIQVLKNENIGYQLESAQNMYDPHLAVIDIIISGLVISFVFITLANKCLQYQKNSNCVIKANGITNNNQREVTIQNNLSSHSANQKSWISAHHNNCESMYNSRDMDSPITTFHLI